MTYSPEYHKNYYEINREHKLERQRKTRLKHKWGITPEQYDELLDKQNGECAVCRKHHSNFKSRLAVDHNHQTHEIRGLLCQNCNHFIVSNHTDGEFFRQIANYVEQGTGWFIPERHQKSV